MLLEERAGNIAKDAILTASGLSEDDCISIARAVIRALYGAGLIVKELPRSTDMSTRFHAHCDWIARHTGTGKDEVYSKALNEAVNRGLYPYVLVTQTVTINSATFDVDVRIPSSTTQASNRELMAAYAVLEEIAGANEIALPERMDYGH